MKFLIGAVVATVLLAASAMAQTGAPTGMIGAPSTSTTTTTATTATPAGPPATSRCGAFPADPTLPDGAHATAAAMEAGNTAYQAWGTAFQAAIACRRQEYNEKNAELESLRAQYNSSAQHINGISASWQASADAFNARHPARPGRH